MKAKITTAAITLTVLFASLATASTVAAEYTFPVIGQSSFTNDYYAPRSNGQHNAIDIIAGKHQKIVSAVPGIIEYVTYPQASWGYAVVVRGDNDNCYWYIHLNNDTPGTDDGQGGAMNAFGPDINPGNPISKGQLIGYVGDSGNAESTVSHLHFETHSLTTSRCTNSSNPAYNPYRPLTQAKYISRPVNYPALPNELLPFGASNPGMAVNFALGNANNDVNNTTDTVVAGGNGSTPRLKVFNGKNVQLLDVNPFPGVTTSTGTDVATGDIDGDGAIEIVAAAKTGQGSKAVIYRLTSQGLAKLNEFDTFVVSRTNVRVAVGDVDGDGKAEIIAGSGVGDFPKVKVFDETGQLQGSFNPYDTKFTHGSEVTVGDISGDAKAEIITGRLGEGSPLVRTFDGVSYSKLTEFYAHDANASKGLRLATDNGTRIGEKAKIIVMANGRTPRVMEYTYDGDIRRDFYYMERWWQGYYDVAASGDEYKLGTGYNRRVSIREN